MAKSKTAAVIIIAVLAATAAVIGYSVLSVKKARQAGGPGMGRGRPGGGQTVFSVKTETAMVKTLQDYVATNGEVESQSSISVFPDISGKIVSVNVSLGTPVHKGQVIARIDPSEPGARYALSPITAPISGSIISTPLKIGTTVNTSTVVTTIGDIGDLQVSASIPERYVASLKTGLKANVYLQAYPDVVFPATVSHVSPVVDSASRTKEIILRFDAKDSRINAGMFAKVILFTVRYEGAVTIPGDAIITKDDKKYVFVADGGKAEQREVFTGHAVDGVYQITSGVYEGEKVVIEGASTLSNGAQIRDITDAAGAAGSAQPGSAPATAPGAAPTAARTREGRSGR